MRVFRGLIDYTIDEYYEKIESSLKMDRIVWGRDQFSSHYMKADNNVRYARFFLANRLNWLCQRWNIDADFTYDLSDNTEHRLSFRNPDNSMSEIMVKDGAQIVPEDLPPYDKENFEGWYYDDGTFEPFSYYIPIYEDMTLMLLPRSEEGRQEYKYMTGVTGIK